MTGIDVPAGTVAVYTDVACGWSTVAIHRFRRARAELGLDAEVALDHRLFPLEVLNRFVLPLGLVESELPVFRRLEPDVGWSEWKGDPSTWAVSTLLANEAVHAAKAQGLGAAEELDYALRLALFRDSRCITMRHEILDVADGCPSVDADRLAEALDDGRARGPMLADLRRHRELVRGSPHFFFADGSDAHNPGMSFHWSGSEEGEGEPVLDHDDPSAYEDLVRRAVASASDTG